MYAKLFSSLFDGSLATRGPWQALVVFQNLLVLADRFGIVDKTPDAISRITTLPLEMVQLGLTELEKPDPDSRRPDHEGRRIIRLDPERAWGWQIVNHAHYRAIRSAEDRRDYQRTYMQDWRAGKRRKDSPRAPSSGNGALGFDDFYAAYPRHVGKAAASKAWSKLAPDEALRTQIADALKRQCPTWTDPNFIPHPASWLNGKRWQDEAPTASFNGSAIPQGAIKCPKCGAITHSFTDGMCDPCWRAR